MNGATRLLVRGMLKIVPYEERMQGDDNGDIIVDSPIIGHEL